MNYIDLCLIEVEVLRNIRMIWHSQILGPMHSQIKVKLDAKFDDFWNILKKFLKRKFISQIENQNDVIISVYGNLDYPVKKNKFCLFFINFRDCVWLLQAPVGRSIKLTFFSFDIGNDTDCSGDFLEVSIHSRF